MTAPTANASNRTKRGTRAWLGYAGTWPEKEQRNDLHWCFAADARYPKMNACSEIYPALATEDPEGENWGWLKTGADYPTMIYPHKSLFSMCFPYGPKAEEAAGKGEILRLRIDRLEDVV